MSKDTKNQTEREFQESTRSAYNKIESAKNRFNDRHYEKKLDKLHERQADVQSKLETAQNAATFTGYSDIMNKQAGKEEFKQQSIKDGIKETSSLSDKGVGNKNEMNTPNTDKDFATHDGSRDFVGSNNKKSDFIDSTASDGIINSNASPNGVLSDRSRQMRDSSDVFQSTGDSKVRKKNSKDLSNIKKIAAYQNPEAKYAWKTDSRPDDKIKKTKSEVKGVSENEFFDGGIMPSRNASNVNFEGYQENIEKTDLFDIDDGSGIKPKNSTGLTGVGTKGDSEKIKKTDTKRNDKVKSKQISGDEKILSKKDAATKDLKTLKKNEKKLNRKEKKLKQQNRRKKIKKYARAEAIEMMLGEDTYNPLDSVSRLSKNVIIDIGKKIGRNIADAFRIACVQVFKWVAVKLLAILGSVLSFFGGLFIPLLAIIVGIVIIIGSLAMMFGAIAPAAIYEEALENTDVTSDPNFFVTRINSKIAEIDKLINEYAEKTYEITVKNGDNYVTLTCKYKISYASNSPNYYKDIIDVYLAKMFETDGLKPWDALTGVAHDYPYFIVDTDEEENILNNVVNCLYYIDTSYADTDHIVYVYKNDKNTYITQYGDIDSSLCDALEEITTNGISLGQLSGVNVPTKFSDEETAALFEEANKHLGTPYVFGACNPGVAFDCSGFVCYVLKASGIAPNLGRTNAQGLYNMSTPVSSEEAKAGDLIFFQGTYDTSDTVTHIGIYAGDGVMIHCGNPVQYTSINTNYWQEHFYSFGRLNR